MATRASKGTGKSVKFEIYVWFNQETGTIRVASNDQDSALSDFNIAVTNNPTKPNGHLHCFAD